MNDSLFVATDTIKVLADTIKVIVVQPSSSSNIKEWFAPAVALLAIFVGPTVQLLIGWRQNKAQVLSTNRQQWMNVLRDQVAEFNSIAYEIMSRQPSKDNEPIGKLYSRAVYLHSKIRLLINPDKPLQIALFNAINEALPLVTEEKKDPVEQGKLLARALDKVNIAGQKLFRDTWVKVKGLK